MKMVYYYSNRQGVWITMGEAENAGLIPVNYKGQTIYMHPEEANAQGLGLFGSKKRKEAERRAQEAAQAAQRANTQVNQSIATVSDQIPRYQRELRQYQSEMNKEINRTDASLPTALAYGGAAAGLIGLGWTVFTKIKNRKR